MKPITLVIVAVVAVASFTAGYFTASHRHRENAAAKEEAIRKEATGFRKAEKSLDDKLTLPKMSR